MEGKKHGITVIPGIEISAYDFTRNRKVHILGYLFDKEATNIQELCDPLLKRRHENSLWQIEQLQKNNFDIRLEDVAEKAMMSGVIYKQHIMHCLLRSSLYNATLSGTVSNTFQRRWNLCKGY